MFRLSRASQRMLTLAIHIRVQKDQALRELDKEKSRVQELEATISALGDKLLCTVDQWFGEEGGLSESGVSGDLDRSALDEGSAARR